MFLIAALVLWFLHSPLLPPALYLAGVWMITTAAVKLAMLLRGRPGALPGVEKDIEDKEFHWD